ncbi:7555_t:CDS:2 [Paraglomus brasilianum]|uniref:7555_t:CDS:1 n=1 Tax=Paraglomus brasilianum TaxID=144538 RepID=A0A9N9BUA1_9GLOM|nr:7555_t:CDS:2 [Paraglomus brasilianum]
MFTGQVSLIGFHIADIANVDVLSLPELETFHVHPEWVVVERIPDKNLQQPYTTLSQDSRGLTDVDALHGIDFDACALVAPVVVSKSQ